ncbi:hypothetical protein [Anaerosporobacter faecicola]|uniref:hypothetical protein n=1 Tax=Anaerosporobacter faecicola TaxID=2718714 RepID=UPI00143B592D|nr:hypothetical protein [Anaerosporobacter faecicola]
MNNGILKENKKASKRNKWWVVVLFIAFAFTLYLVEASPFSSTEVAKYNNGYGTFDMKSYDVDQVTSVLSTMEDKGFSVYRSYFICDTFFILAFGAFQLYLAMVAFSWCKKKSLRYLVYAVVIARGCFDFVENVLLYTVLDRFPGKIGTLVQIASAATQGKLWCIRIWGVSLLIGIFGLVYTKKIRKSIS